MTTFPDEQARRRLDAVLRPAGSQGEARIRMSDGQEYAVRPVAANTSPLDLPGIDLRLSAGEIVGFVREGWERKG